MYCCLQLFMSEIIDENVQEKKYIDIYTLYLHILYNIYIYIYIYIYI